MSGCLLVACGLLGAAMFMPKEQAPSGWTTLNSAVEAALQPEHSIESGFPEAKSESGEGSGLRKQKDAEGQQGNTTANGSSGKPSSNSVGVGQNGNGEVEAAQNDTGEVVASSTDSGKLDINRATVQELDGLKGIGPAKAKAIVENREKNGRFTSVDDLQRVKGIGSKLLEGMKDSIVANP